MSAMSRGDALARDNQACERREYIGSLLIQSVNIVIKGGAKRAVCSEDIQALYKLSKAHGLHVLVFDSLNLEGIDPVMIAAWARDIQQNFIFDQLLRQDHEKIQTVLRDAGIPFLSLKGVALKDLYPQSHYRVMADLDYFLPYMNLDAVSEVLLGLGYLASDHGMSFHAGFTNENGLRIEMHRALLSFGHVFEGFSHYLERSVHNDGSELSWSHEDEYLFLLLHLAKHFMSAGVGVRQVLDIFLYQENTIINLHYIYNVLKRFDLYKFYEKVQALIAFWFQSAGSVNSQVVEMANVILSSGSYGYVDRVIINNLQKEMCQNSSRIRYFLKRMFPSQNYMCYIYPTAGRRLFLIPILWVHRLITRSITHRRIMMLEIKVVFEADKMKVNSNDRFFY